MLSSTNRTSLNQSIIISEMRPVTVTVTAHIHASDHAFTLHCTAVHASLVQDDLRSCFFFREGTFFSSRFNAFFKNKSSLRTGIPGQFLWQKNHFLAATWPHIQDFYRVTISYYMSPLHTKSVFDKFFVFSTCIPESSHLSQDGRGTSTGTRSELIRM
jgi:hypothetical protein